VFFGARKNKSEGDCLAQDSISYARPNQRSGASVIGIHSVAGQCDFGIKFPTRGDKLDLPKQMARKQMPLHYLAKQ
jgi:hypothetical protein